MISAILTKIKQWARWVYDWITVITASLVGLPTLLIQLLNYFGTIDLSPLIGPDMALKVVTGVAIAKAALAFIESRVRGEESQ